MNLLAIEPYGHGATRSRYRHFTYWDSAIAALQVMETLGIDMAFALGTSQGGWIATRMALLDPDAIRGIVVVGTSMDYESQASMERGCWDGSGFCTPAIDALVVRTASVNLRDRDGLEARLGDVVCPVLWLQGTADAVYSVANAEDGIARFTGSPSAELQIVEGGQHFLTASDPQTANSATLAFVEKWS